MTNGKQWDHFKYKDDECSVVNGHGLSINCHWLYLFGEKRLHSIDNEQSKLNIDKMRKETLNGYALYHQHSCFL